MHHFSPIPAQKLKSAQTAEPVFLPCPHGILLPLPVRVRVSSTSAAEQPQTEPPGRRIPRAFLFVSLAPLSLSDDWWAAAAAALR